MKRLGIFALTTLLLAACSTADTPTDDDPHTPVLPTDPHDPADPTNPTDPNDPKPPRPNPESFDTEMLAEGAHAPVVAVADGVRHHAFIDAQGEAVLALDGVASALPVAGVSRAIGITAGPDGALHVVWDPDGAIQYLRVDFDGTMHGPMLVADEGRDPNIVVTNTDGVVVGYTVDKDDEADHVMIAEGTVSGTFGGFDPPTHINPGCCMGQYEEPAYRVSGPSLAVAPDGAVHVLYEWMGNFDTTIDYVRQDGAYFTAPLEVARAAFAPCPAIAVDDRGAHITYLLEQNQDVWYVTVSDDVVGEASSIHTLGDSSGYIYLALMALDADGIMHVAVQQQREGVAELLYLRAGESPLEVASRAFPGDLALSPTAGGFVLYDDTVLLPYTSRDGQEVPTNEAMLAEGR